MAFFSRRARALVLSAAAVMSGLGAWTVSASAADNSRITDTFDDVLPFCADPIRAQGLVDEVLHVYYDRAGDPIRLAITGKVKVTLTNLATGATFSPNISGPLTIDLATGQPVSRGGTLFVDNDGRLVVTNGRVVVAADGSILSIFGRVRSVCEELGTTPA
jgi:hypothetical protein